MSLHWLKVNKRITYKIAMLVYKCMNGSAPVYLAELVINTIMGHYVQHIEGGYESPQPEYHKCLDLPSL